MPMGHSSGSDTDPDPVQMLARSPMRSKHNLQKRSGLVGSFPVRPTNFQSVFPKSSCSLVETIFHLDYQSQLVFVIRISGPLFYQVSCFHLIFSTHLARLILTSPTFDQKASQTSAPDWPFSYHSQETKGSRSKMPTPSDGVLTSLTRSPAFTVCLNEKVELVSVTRADLSFDEHCPLLVFVEL